MADLVKNRPSHETGLAEITEGDAMFERSSVVSRDTPGKPVHTGDSSPGAEPKFKLNLDKLK